MSLSLLAPSHQPLIPVFIPAAFLFDVPYHLSFPAESVTTDCLHRNDFI